MANVLNRITELVRTELNDGTQSRWTDAELLAFMKQAVRRANALGQRKRLAFMRGKQDYTLAAGESSLTLPTDFLTPISLTRMDTNQPLDKTDGDRLDTIVSATEAAVYSVEDGTIDIMAAPVNDVPLRLRYYVDAAPDALTLPSPMPWGGKLDYILCEYVELRARKVDRYDTSMDIALLDDMEKQIVAMYGDLGQTVHKSRGWNGGRV
jgi:hypothetical protein